MTQSTEKIESASAALGGNDKEDGKAKISSMLQQLDADKNDDGADNMDTDDKDADEDLHDEGLLGTEIAEEIEKSLGANELTILREVKKLQIQHFFINKSYEDELQKIKFKYEKLYKPLYVKRRELLANGKPDVTLANADTIKNQSGTPYIPSYWLSCMKRHRSLDELIEDQDEAILEYLIDIRCEYIYKEKDGAEYLAIEDIPKDLKKDVDDSADISSVDRKELSPILNNDETLKSLSSSSSASAFESFRLIFEFIDNPYFTPNTLTKEYHLTSSQIPGKKDGEDKKDDDKKDDEEKKDKKDEEKSLLSEALALAKLLHKDATDDQINKNLLILSEGNTAELEKTVSTIIQWKEGKDPTKKIVVKKQRNRRTKQTRTVQETVISDSFFNFFSNHVLPKQADLDNMSQKQAAELQMVVEADYDIGVLIRDRIIPESATWFLGLAMESDEEFGGGDDEDEEEDDYDSDFDSEEEARGKGGSKKRY